MSRKIEAIMAPLVPAAEQQSVAPTYKIKLTARWQTGLQAIFGNTQWKVRLKKIESTSKRLISTAAVLILLALAQGSVAGDKADPADEKALQEQNEAFVAAFNRGDIKAVAEAYAPDADFLSAQGQRVKGRDALEKYFAKGFAGSKGLTLKHSDSSIRFLKPDVAIADGTWEITGRPEGNPARGYYTAILMKRDGQWLIVYDRPMVPLQPAKP
jgi:uncharacterized protein (TIGR02246 family)